MRVCFTNLGCKLNQAELERLARRFHAAGHRVVARPEEADLQVVNSCTVTHVAARGSRKTARRGARRNPGLKTVLTGCWATEEPAAAAELAGVDLVVPNADKESLLEAVHRHFCEALPEALPGEGAGAAGGEPFVFPGAELAFGNTRPLVKVEDGCNVGCTFCIIPLTRGRQRSRPPAEVVAEVAALVERGAREVVIEGVQISHYRHAGAGLVELVEAILADTAVPRLRLTSIAPWSLDERLLELWRDPRLCRHLHMSLQSGCDATLGRMRRPYTAARYAAAVAALRRAVPGVAITTDVIVGFPGESEAEFAASRDFVRRMAFARIHAFPYSTRSGTAAAELADRVPHTVKRRRMAEMLELAAEAERDFHRAHLGKTLEVLWERRRDGVWQGMTDNYIRVFAGAAETGSTDLVNGFTPTRLEALADGGVRGRPLGDEPFTGSEPVKKSSRAAQLLGAGGPADRSVHGST